MTHLRAPDHAVYSTERHEIVDAVVVGAGFAGLYMLYRLRERGLRVRVIEAGADVGGTWYWNRYPGARCDAQSLLYSYSFSEDLQDEWSWSEKYATQPEILEYIRYVADRFRLRPQIWFETQVASAHFDEARTSWEVHTDSGDRVTARYLIMATGCLSVGRVPDLPGLDETGLEIYHTGSWPHEGMDFTGKRVGVVGTGSSGIQLIPELARQAEGLVVFQRTPNFSVPARNGPLDPDDVATFTEHRESIRDAWRAGNLIGAGEKLRPDNTFMRPVSALAVSEEEREREFEGRWNEGGAFFVGAFNDLATDLRANETAADFVNDKIRTTVSDPATAKTLIPTGYPLGAKRICVGSDYFETFNRQNVELVDLRERPIERITADGIAVAGGEFKLDALVFATGFDAMTGALLRMDITGVGGLALGDKWKDGPGTYLGLMTSGFPNMFMITGPGSPSVLGNVVCHIEQHVDMIADLLDRSREDGLECITVEREAEERWVQTVNEVADATLYTKAESWYLGSNVPGKPRVFMPFAGGIGAYRDICEQVVGDDYAGFSRTPAGVSDLSADRQATGSIQKSYREKV